MTLAISDTDLTPIDILKVQSGDPFAFQQLYRKFYSILADEATLLCAADQAIALVQLGSIQCWIRCQQITSERYYIAYIRNQELRYNHKNGRIHRELGIVNEIVSPKYKLGMHDLIRLYEQLTIAQRELIRETFKSYFQPWSGGADDQEGGTQAAPPHPLLKFAFNTLHYILA